MAKCEIEKLYLLKLNQSEAEWLYGKTQNPLSEDPNPKHELDEDRKPRYSIWNALHQHMGTGVSSSVGIKSKKN